MRYLGIDTDTRGSIALLDFETSSLTVYKMPAREVEINGSDKLRIDKRALCDLMLRLIAKTRPAVIVFEEQWARPATGVGKNGEIVKKQGIASTFTFAEAYGSIQGAVYSAVAHVRTTDTSYEPQICPVTGSKWKAGFNIPRDKKAAVGLATKFFPDCAGYWSLAANVSAAEASLIALYGAIIFGSEKFVNVNGYTPVNLDILGFEPISVLGTKRGRKR